VAPPPPPPFFCFVSGRWVKNGFLPFRNASNLLPNNLYLLLKGIEPNFNPIFKPHAGSLAGKAYSVCSFLGIDFPKYNVPLIARRFVHILGMPDEVSSRALCILDVAHRIQFLKEHASDLRYTVR
jgi:hypothetical protein